MRKCGVIYCVVKWGSTSHVEHQSIGVFDCMERYVGHSDGDEDSSSAKGSIVRCCNNHCECLTNGVGDECGGRRCMMVIVLFAASVFINSLLELLLALNVVPVRNDSCLPETTIGETRYTKIQCPANL